MAIKRLFDFSGTNKKSRKKSLISKGNTGKQLGNTLDKMLNKATKAISKSEDFKLGIRKLNTFKKWLKKRGLTERYIYDYGLSQRNIKKIGHTATGMIISHAKYELSEDTRKISNLKGVITKWQKKTGLKLNWKEIEGMFPKRPRRINKNYMAQIQKTIDIVKARMKLIEKDYVPNMLNLMIENWIDRLWITKRLLDVRYTKPYIDEIEKLFQKAISQWKNTTDLYEYLRDTSEQLDLLLETLNQLLYENTKWQTNLVPAIFEITLKIADILKVKWDVPIIPDNEDGTLNAMDEAEVQDFIDAFFI